MYGLCTIYNLYIIIFWFPIFMFIDDLSLIDISLGIDGHALEIQNSQEILKSDILILKLLKLWYIHQIYA